MSLCAFSQIVTQKDSLMCLPVRILRAVSKDLLRGDSAIAQLKVANSQIEDMHTLVNIKDSVIVNLTIKDLNNLDMIDALHENNAIVSRELDIAENQLLRERKKITNFGIATGVIFALLAIFK